MSVLCVVIECLLLQTTTKHFRHEPLIRHSPCSIEGGAYKGRFPHRNTLLVVVALLLQQQRFCRLLFSRRENSINSIKLDGTASVFVSTAVVAPLTTSPPPPGSSWWLGIREKKRSMQIQNYDW